GQAAVCLKTCGVKISSVCCTRSRSGRLTLFRRRNFRLQIFKSPVVLRSGAGVMSSEVGYNFCMPMTGIQLFLDLLAAEGVRHIFGNPGTTEMPLNDALVGDRRFQYVL